MEWDGGQTGWWGEGAAETDGQAAKRGRRAEKRGRVRDLDRRVTYATNFLSKMTEQTKYGFHQMENQQR